DGIRDLIVTGVQTCALPIYVEKAGEGFLFRMSASPEPLIAAMARLELALMRMRQGSSDEYLIEWDRNPDDVFKSLKSTQDLPPRSEERRVGKEGRSRGTEGG